MLETPSHLLMTAAFRFISSDRFSKEVWFLATEKRDVDYLAAFDRICAYEKPAYGDAVFWSKFLERVARTLSRWFWLKRSPATPRLAALHEIEERTRGFGRHGPLDRQAEERKILARLTSERARELAGVVLETGLDTLPRARATVRVDCFRGAEARQYRPRVGPLSGRLQISVLLDALAQNCPFWGRGWRHGFQLQLVWIGNGVLELHGRSARGETVDIRIPALCAEIANAEAPDSELRSQLSPAAPSRPNTPPPSWVFAMMLLPFVAVAGLFGVSIWSVNRTGR